MGKENTGTNAGLYPLCLAEIFTAHLVGHNF